MSTLSFPTTVSAALKGAEVVLVLLPQRRLGDGWLTRALDAPWRDLLVAAAKGEEAGPSGSAIAVFNAEAGPKRVVLGLLPDDVSRHNAPSRAAFVYALASGAGLADKRAAVIACLEEPEHALPIAREVARALPLFSRASTPPSGKGKPRASRTAFLGLDVAGQPVRMTKSAKAVVERSRWAALLVDSPTAEMNAADFEKATRKAARGLEHVRVRSIVGKDLLEKKLGGIHAVGRTAMTAPRLLLIEYRPPKAKRHIGVVGKGIVYDTGGLSLKSSVGMPHMKADMGGAAAAVAATLALAEGGARVKVTCATPLAENAIGPNAYRPDDIVRFHSGKTVEINNTDAEGRLVLADGVSYVARHYKVDAVIDAATLTGAQLVATGTRHAAVVSNRAGLENLAITVGRTTGDLTAPLPFAPELFQQEFKSKVADMKNSVANRMNAQSSCAGQFIYAHIQDLDIPWLHVDLAGPAFREDRATGYGVALLAGVVEGITNDVLAE